MKEKSIYEIMWIVGCGICGGSAAHLFGHAGGIFVLGLVLITGAILLSRLDK